MVRKEKRININHDANWKFIIEELFPECMAFFIPELAKEIDYTHAPEFLEQELHKIVSDKTRKGKIINDKLVKVHLKNGEDKWVLIHIEIQGTDETHFSKRMFSYFYRILDKYDKEIAALAIYTGKCVPRKKNTFNYEFYGTKLEYEFNTYVVKDAKEEDLLNSNNPFALVILAIKHLHKSSQDSNETYLFKLRLTKLCKEKGQNNRQIISLFKFIDLSLQTPKELELKFAEEALHILIDKTKEMETKVSISESYVGHLYKALHGETIEEKFQKLEREKELEKEQAVKNLLQKLNLSVESVADILNISVEKVIEIKKKMSV